MTLAFDGTKLSSIEQKAPISTLSCRLSRAASPALAVEAGIYPGPVLELNSVDLEEIADAWPTRPTTSTGG